MLCKATKCLIAASSISGFSEPWNNLNCLLYVFKVAEIKFAVLVPNLYNIPLIPISFATFKLLPIAFSSCTRKASTFVRPNKVSVSPSAACIIFPIL